MTISTQSPFTAASGHSGCAAYFTCAPSTASQRVRHGTDLCGGRRAGGEGTLKDGAGGPAVPAPLQGERNAEALGQVALGEDVLEPAYREHRTAPHQHGMGESLRNLFDVVGHHHHGGRRSVGRERRDPLYKDPAPTEIKAGGRLV